MGARGNLLLRATRHALPDVHCGYAGVLVALGHRHAAGSGREEVWLRSELW